MMTQIDVCGALSVQELLSSTENREKVNQSIYTSIPSQNTSIMTSVAHPIESTRTESFTLVSSLYSSVKGLTNEAKNYKLIGSVVNLSEKVAEKSLQVR